MTDDLAYYAKADRTQLQQIIAALDDGVIVVEPDQTIAWANRAALAMHGVAAVAELGADIDQYRARFELRYRNNHVVPEGKYPLDRVMLGEAFSEIIVEVGPSGGPAQWTHRLRSIVLTRPDGKPDCLVLIINDETERFNAQERFEKTFAANPAPAIICRLDDLRYVKVNLGFQELTGFTEDDLIGRLLYDVDILQAAERRELALERMRDRRTIPQMEASLPTADGGTKLVILAGQPIEIGEDACILFTFADLEPRRRSEDALKQSEARFSKAFRMAPVPMMVSSIGECRMLDVNQAFCAVTGFAREEVIGRTDRELELWGDPADADRIAATLHETGHLHSVEVALHNRSGDVIDHLLSAETVDLHGTSCVLSVMQDISARKRSQQELVAAIDAVMQDTSWFGQRIVEKLANLSRAQQSHSMAQTADLTARERDVLSLVAGGDADAAIATRLKLSQATVRNHVTAIYAKIGVNRRAAAVVWARERGFNGEQKPTSPRTLVPRLRKKP
jgi:PAS domain S-box-containing protein